MNLKELDKQMQEIYIKQRKQEDNNKNNLEKSFYKILSQTDIKDLDFKKIISKLEKNGIKVNSKENKKKLEELHLYFTKNYIDKNKIYIEKQVEDIKLQIENDKLYKEDINKHIFNKKAIVGLTIIGGAAYSLADKQKAMKDIEKLYKKSELFFKDINEKNKEKFQEIFKDLLKPDKEGKTIFMKVIEKEHNLQNGITSFFQSPKTFNNELKTKSEFLHNIAEMIVKNKGNVKTKDIKKVMIDYDKNSLENETINHSNRIETLKTATEPSKLFSKQTLKDIYGEMKKGLKFIKNQLPTSSNRFREFDETIQNSFIGKIGKSIDKKKIKFSSYGINLDIKNG